VLLNGGNKISGINRTCSRFKNKKKKKTLKVFRIRIILRMMELRNNQQESRFN